MGEGQGITLTCVFPHCHRFPEEDYIWWVTHGHGDSGKNEEALCVVVCCVWRSVQLESTQPQERLGPQRGEGPQGSCDCLFNTFKLLTNFKKCRECNQVIDTIHEGIAEESKQKTTDELERFIQAENKEAR